MRKRLDLIVFWIRFWWIINHILRNNSSKPPVGAPMCVWPLISTCDMETWSLFVWPGWHAIPRWKSWVLQCAIAKPNQRVIWLHWMELSWCFLQGEDDENAWNLENYDFTVAGFLIQYHYICILSPLSNNHLFDSVGPSMNLHDSTYPQKSNLIVKQNFLNPNHIIP